MVRILILLFIFLTAPELGAVDFWIGKIEWGLKWGGAAADNIPQAIVNIIKFLAGFLYFLWVVLAIYAWFLILISWGDEEKVKKGRSIIIYVAIGLIVIFLAANIVEFIITVLNPGAVGAPTFGSGAIN